MLGSRETARFISASSRGLGFLKDERSKTETSVKELYFLKEGRELASSREGGFYGK